MFYSAKHGISFKIKSKFIKFYMFFGNICWLYLCFQSTRVTPRITLKSLCSSLRPKYISMLGVKYQSKKNTEEKKYIYIRLQIWAFFPFIYFSLFTRAVAKFNFSFVRTLSKISPAADVLTYIFGDLEKLENPRIHHSKSGRGLLSLLKQKYKQTWGQVG